MGGRVPGAPAHVRRPVGGLDVLVHLLVADSECERRLVDDAQFHELGGVAGIGNVRRHAGLEVQAVRIRVQLQRSRARLDGRRRHDLLHVVPDVQVHELALSDESRQVDFFVVKDDPWISALHNPQEIRDLVGDTRRSDWREQVETISVTASRLDDVLDASQTIDFIKMDVEGAEVAVFRGALRTLSVSSPIVVFEYSGVDVEELYGATNLLDTLSEVGFRVSSLEGWLAGDSQLEPSEFPNFDRASGFWNWMYVAHPSR